MRVTCPNLIAATVARLRAKSFRFRYDYGEKPVLRDEDLTEARREELKYKQIRFAATHESCSPFIDPVFEKFASFFLSGGRRGTCYDIMHRTLYTIKCRQIDKLRKRELKKSTSDETNGQELEEQEEIILDPMLILHKAITNCEPVVIIKKVKRGGAIYQVPYPIVSEESTYFAMKWLADVVKNRPRPRKKLFPDAMASELIDAAYGRGKVVKMKDDIHRLGAANKAYAHYRWG